MRMVLAIALLTMASPVRAQVGDPETRARGEQMAQRAIEYLRSQQDGETGGWAVNPGGPQLPAITGLVVTGMLLDPGVTPEDGSVREGLGYILSFRQADGGIYDQILPSYNTAICLSALARALVDGAQGPQGVELRGAIVPAQRFLRGLQWTEDAIEGDELSAETTGRVGPEHPFYGGIGYGSSGRPDNSNLNLMLQALHDSGVPSTDPAYQRALVFLQRTQMVDAINDMPYADGSGQGGFIYATSPNSDEMGVGESKAGTIEERLEDGTVASRLRSYGSMTYAGFKSYLYADLPRDDPRVLAAYGWLRENYTLEENPGVGTDGLYYYYITLARALSAWGEPTIEVSGEAREWAGELIEHLATLQNPDGSFKSVDDRWMENNPVLITAYSLIALEHALHGAPPSLAPQP